MKKKLFWGPILIVLISLMVGIGYIKNEVVNPPEESSRQPPEATIVSEVSDNNYLPNDSYFDKQWALIKIGVPRVWEITSDSQDILIAILDTGIDKKHEDLKDKVVAEINFSNSPTVNDVYGHGTHIAGIVAANTNNNLGIAGIAPDVKLMNVKVADDLGFCNSLVLAKGIIWAVDNGAKIINISLAINKPSLALEEAVNYAWDRGVIVIAAAGNLRRLNLTYPAYYPNCLAVASTDANNSLSFWSNHSDWADVAAPGNNIYSTLPNNSYGYKSGTSQSAAQVSGIAALLFNIVTDRNENGFLNDEIREIIEISGTNISQPDVSQKCLDAFKVVWLGLLMAVC